MYDYISHMWLENLLCIVNKSGKELVQVFHANDGNYVAIVKTNVDITKETTKELTNEESK